MKKPQPGGYRDFGDIDPAVSQLLGEAAQRKANRAMTPSQRKKAARDAARNKVTIDMPPQLEEQLKIMAADLSVPFSSLAVYLLGRAVGLVDVDTIRAARVATRSMRYEYVIPWEDSKE